MLWFFWSAALAPGLPHKYHFNVVGTSVKKLRREYSNISLRNALEINAPRDQIWTLVNIINIREEKRKKRKKSLKYTVAN